MNKGDFVMRVETEEYFDIEKRKEVRDEARKLRRKFLRLRREHYIELMDMS